MLARVWQDRRLGIALAVGVAVLAGLIIGLGMPRGPATALQALFVMAACLAAGLAAGLRHAFPVGHTYWPRLPTSS